MRLAAEAPNNHIHSDSKKRRFAPFCMPVICGY